ncbi:MAG: fibronectin type III domain-containing protein, partial [Phaeodactylibacter sp.]|uniref:fibronectin type III domain-containing protein n=1 Tax=Phaeodactylibacter sp. TaxID=1940289 RepID=UPI0032EDCEB5
DADDQCPGFDDSLIGTSCNDGDDCTINDVYTSDCDCAGTFQDSDNDGVCDADDQCPGLNDALIGTSCDDGDACTENDLYGADCGCAGTLIDANNNNICDLDETDECTAPTNLQASNISAGSAALSWSASSAANEYELQYLVEDAPFNSIITLSVPGNGYTLTGLASNTTYLWRVRAVCNGESSPYSGIGNFTTTDGACPDSDNDGVCDADDQCPGFDDSLIGTSCNDGDDCTINDVYTSDCDCAGTFQDSDNDGVCDADDQCPGLNDALIGTSCDDGDACTENDLYGADCGCAGTLIDANNNNICDLDEGCAEPVNLNAFANSSTSATFEWSPIPNADAYRLQYRPIGFGPVSIDIPSSTYTDNNLPSGSTVQWRVRALCSSENSAFVNGPSVTLGSSLPMGAPTVTTKADELKLTLFPNPARDQVTLTVNHLKVASTVVVRNMMGQTLGSYLMGEDGQLTLSTAEWGNNQILLVTIYPEGQEPVSQRLVISR